MTIRVLITYNTLTCSSFKIKIMLIYVSISDNLPGEAGRTVVSTSGYVYDCNTRFRHSVEYLAKSFTSSASPKILTMIFITGDSVS